jgi:hypothetical protein
MTPDGRRRLFTIPDEGAIMTRLSEQVEGIVHEPTQIHDDRVDLTVSECFEVTSPGRIDFGGGELEDAELTPHEQVFRNPDDDYRWWHLDSGQYLIEYNERVDADDRLVVQPREELLERGSTHPTIHVRTLPRVPVQVSGAGLRLKENARVSMVLAED